MRYLVTLLILSFVVLSSGCDSDGYSCTSEGCYADDNSPQYLTLDDCLSVCEEITPKPSDCSSLVSHEGYDYSTVQIGDQCWFAENCRYLPSVSDPSTGNSGNPFYYVYDYQGTDVESAKATSNYQAYGVLYNWPAVESEGLCPSGWHIPSDLEFTQLTDFLGGEDIAGGSMKEPGYDHWSSPNSGATNYSGFNGLPGGDLVSDVFDLTGYYGYWWSSSESGLHSWARGLGYLDGGVVYRDTFYRNFGFSARCVRD